MFWHRRSLHKPTGEVEASLLSDIGCCRETNEDAGRIIRPTGPQVLAEKGTLLIVADGMGGCEGGEIASQLAIQTIGRSYYANRSQISAALIDAFTEANDDIHRFSLERPDLKGMGTTCTALVLRDDLAWVAYVGDTRLYLIRNGGIYRMVEDHSAVMELVKQGVVTLQEARRHADRNVILRALGTHERVCVSTWNAPLPIRTWDRFVLCTDGLYDQIEDEEIRNATEAATPAAACCILIALARQRGGGDNITVAVARVGPLQTAQPQVMRETRAVEVTR